MSKQRFNFKEAISSLVKRKRKSVDKIPLAGKFKIKHFRKGILIAEYEFPNGIVNEGKDRILDVMFSDGTQIAANSWFMGIIDAASFSALAAGDTMSSHAGWIEMTTYDSATRPAWGPGNPSSQSITNASPVQFVFSATATAKGIFICSNSTKGGTTGLLWTTGLFASDVPVVDDDELNVTYTLSC